jgi:RNA polymerase sigma-70 factor (ECF subfamily)
MFMDDLQAIRRLKSGDAGGLEILVTRYQRKAVQTAFLITHDEQLADEVVQETFVRLYQHIRHFDESRPLGPYLLRSVANAALNAAKKTRRWVQIGAGNDTIVEAVAELLSEATSLEDQAEYHALRERIFKAMQSLSPRQRAVIVQRYYLGMSEKEMAESASVAPGTIKWWLNSARASLRHLLHPERSPE